MNINKKRILLISCFTILVVLIILFCSNNKIKEKQITNDNKVKSATSTIENIVSENHESYTIEDKESLETNDNIVEVVTQEVSIVEQTNEQIIGSNIIQEPVSQEPSNNVNLQSVEDDYSNSYVGVYTITAYTWTGNTMANGEYPYVGCAASCDFPLGTQLNIEGIGIYVVTDVCPTSGVIDLYMNSYDECIAFGRQSASVYIIN